MAQLNPIAVWFGTEGSELFGSLYLPEDAARGVIVLCHPLGREYTHSHQSFVRLANQLCHLGFAALRFDYRSTGDSFERADDTSEGFAHDVAAAIAFARELGVGHVGVVGMRLGANALAVQRPDVPLDAAVLWDPCPSGKSFMREQRALAMFAEIRVEYADSFDLPQMRLSPGMAEELRSYDLVNGPALPVEEGLLANKVLLLTRAERELEPEIRDRFSLPQVEWRQVAGQPALLDLPEEWPIAPIEALKTVADWLDHAMSRSGDPIRLPSRREVVVAAPVVEPGSNDATGTREITERAVRLGPAALFGIETEPVGGGTGPVCLFVSVANEHRIGPGRTWVQLCRRLAAHGFHCVRFDINGFGDSPSRDGRIDPPVQSISAVEDIVDAAAAVSPEDPSHVLLFGLCSSGYQILEASTDLRPLGICVLNPSLTFWPAELVEGKQLDARRRFFLHPPRGRPPQKPWAEWLKKKLPTFATLLATVQLLALRRWRRFRGRFNDGPGRRIGDLVQAGTDVFLICGFNEIQHFWNTGIDAARRVDRGNHLHVEAISSLDHGLGPVGDRVQVTSLILSHMIEEQHKFAALGEMTAAATSGRA